MKNKINLLIYSLIITTVLFGYLTIHHYAVQLGLNGPGLCNVNASINCDAAAISSYSELFKIPIAVFGFCFNLVMLFIVLAKKMNWSEENKNQNAAIKFLFTSACVISIVLFIISIFKVHVICPFCLATYVFSFINTYFVWNIFSPSDFTPLSMISNKSNIVTGISILVLSWFISGVIQDNYGLDEMKKIAPEKITRWQNAPLNTFVTTTGLIQNENGKITLVEFADFKCPHCKMASQTLHHFIQAHPEIKFIYKPFPLDGICNPEITQKGDGSRCKMAAWALCTEKISHKGWDIHKWYFDNQEDLEPITDMKETNTSLAKMFNLNFDEIEKCSESVSTFDEIKKMTEEAKTAKVEGTPTLFLNGKKLEAGHFPEIIRSAVQTLTE